MRQAARFALWTACILLLAGCGQSSTSPAVDAVDSSTKDVPDPSRYALAITINGNLVPIDGFVAYYASGGPVAFPAGDDEIFAILDSLDLETVLVVEAAGRIHETTWGGIKGGYIGG